MATYFCSVPTGSAKTARSASAGSRQRHAGEFLLVLPILLIVLLGDRVRDVFHEHATSGFGVPRGSGSGIADELVDGYQPERHTRRYRGGHQSSAGDFRDLTVRHHLGAQRTGLDDHHGEQGNLHKSAVRLCRPDNSRISQASRRLRSTFCASNHMRADDGTRSELFGHIWVQSDGSSCPVLDDLPVRRVNVRLREYKQRRFQRETTMASLRKLVNARIRDDAWLDRAAVVAFGVSSAAGQQTAAQSRAAAGRSFGRRRSRRGVAALWLILTCPCCSCCWPWSSKSATSGWPA